MFYFDNKHDRLVICKVPKEKPNYVYEECDMYKSYMKYVKEGMIEDISNKFIPALSQTLENAGESEIYIKDFEVFEDKYSNYRGWEYYSLKVNFGGIGVGNDMDKFVIFKIPYMDKFGVVYREGKTYALISELVQDDDITYGDGELKIITKGGCYINIKAASKTSKNIVTKFRGKNLKTIEILFGLAEEEGLNGVELFKKLKSVELNNLFKSDTALNIACMDWAKTQNVAFVDILKKDMYNVSAVRNRLNEVFSIDKALGEVLFEPVKLKDGKVYPYGTLITESVLRDLKQSHINEVYVKYIPNMVGQYLARNVQLRIIRKGTEMIECLEGALPDEDGMFVSKDYVFDEGNEIIIPIGTVVTEGMLEAFAYNGYTEVFLSESDSNLSIYKEVPLEISIIGNRHYKCKDVGVGLSDDYVYITENDEILPASETFTAYDMLAMISLFDRLSKGLDYNLVADRDMGLRKKVNQANELFHKAFDQALNDYIPKIRNKFVNVYKKQRSQFFDADAMEAMFMKFSDIWWQKLYKMKVVNVIDKMNPVSYYSSFNKINTIIADKNAIKRSQHSLSMGHFNRICPYETPSGKTMGVVGNKVPLCKIVENKMLTPYYRVRHIGDRAFISDVKEYMTVQEEEKYRIGSITALDVNWETREILTKGRVLARVPSQNSLEKMTVADIDLKYIELVNCDPQQTESMTAQTIPFAGADDSARVIFGLSMAKQAKGQVDGQIPLVNTNAFYDLPRTSDYYMIHAEKDGIVQEVSNDFVAVLYDDERQSDDDYDNVRVYEFKPRDLSVNSIVIRTVNVKEGQRIKAGDVLVRSNYVKDDVMVTGQNALVGYGSMGYNYEDGLYVAKRFGYNSMSYGVKVEKEKVPKAFNSVKISDVDKYKYIKKHDKLYSIQYNNGDYSNNFNVYADHAKGFIIKCSAVDSNRNNSTTIVTECVSLDYMHEGDKTANRHGNKGVTPRITDNSKMPAFNNGEFLDIVYNPEGLPSRMNFGQVLECHIGLCCYITKIGVDCDSFNGASIYDITLLLSLVWNLANTDDWESILGQDRFKVLPKEYIQRLYDNKDYIRTWENCFNEDGTAWLINPYTGTYFENPVLVGVNYVYKLYHEVLNKEHARAGYCTEPYVAKLNSPPKGSSKEGGQRLGYMEFDALMQYGATEMLYEFQNARGDNGVARNNFIVDALHDSDEYKLPKDTAIRRSTEYFVAMLEALGFTTDFEGALPNKVIDEYSRRRMYKPKALINANFSTEDSKQQVDVGYVASKKKFEDMI